MYYFELERKLFLHSSVHKEVSDINNIDINKYIFVTDDMYSYFLSKRKDGYGIYAKNGNVLITMTIRPSNWHELDNDGNWFITDQKAAEKYKFETEEELRSKQREYSKLREDIIFNYIMDRTDEINMLKEQVIPLENKIHDLQEQLASIFTNVAS